MMPWADAAGALAQLIPQILEVVCHRVAGSQWGERRLRSDPPPPASDSDDWKCPDASQIARALGTGPKSIDD
jgi:hypothetical protein